MSAARRDERNARFNSTSRGCLPFGRLPVILSGLQVIATPLDGAALKVALMGLSLRTAWYIADAVWRRETGGSFRTGSG
jgi:hypothetical protein